MSQCDCGLYGGASDRTGRRLPNHVCSANPPGYVELDRYPDEAEIEIEREAKRLGIHPFELIRRRHEEKKEAERLAAEAQRDALSEKWGMTP